MLIESIKIENFRQFFHEIELNFSTDSNKNVTVIHGANGSGKTSLLNAFKWCFYGHTDFDTLNDKILNESAIQEKKGHGVLEIRVCVAFKHGDKSYNAVRHQTYKCIDALQAEPIEKSIFNLDVTGEDGQTKRSKSPFVELKAILPEDLQPYFFFNGERIEHIAGVSQGGQVRDAIRKLMGLELVDRAIVHLSRAKKQYRNIVREEVSEEQRVLHDLIQKLEEDIQRFKESRDSAKTEEEGSKAELKRIGIDLRKFENSRGLQEKRDDLDTRLGDSLVDIARIRTKQKKLMEENGFLVISEKMFSSCKVLVDKNRKKGILPFGIKEQFIDDRIEIGVCICGAKISKGSNEHQCLLDVRRTAGTDEVESTYTGVSALLRSHDEVVENFGEDYREESKRLKLLLEKSESIRTEINEISAQLIEVNDKLIAKLEKEHQEQESNRDRALAERFTANYNFKEAMANLEAKQQLLKRLDVQKSVQNIAQSRMDKAQEIVEILDSLQESLANQVRLDLSERVNDTFQSIIRKPVRAIIDDDYSLQVMKSTNEGEEYVASEQSTGERQVTSLSFISSIIALAKEKHSKKTLFFQGGLYPLVMDSPFGALDDDYREKVASKVAELAEQVIIFVSNSQWKGKVKEACEDKVGGSYKLVYHIPNLTKTKENDYEISSESDFEYSTVEEVEI
jgi:DNA sulfur modification protein DndD